MERRRVNSSNINSIGYEPGSMTLEVEFHSGSVYQYYGVPEHVNSAFMSAASKGTFLNDNIKDRYRCRQVR